MGDALRRSLVAYVSGISESFRAGWKGVGEKKEMKIKIKLPQFRPIRRHLAPFSGAEVFPPAKMGGKRIAVDYSPT